jgi:crotonobetainyl-CoA:carnitine CoA-transferase CaiB-like acyl-CoA transferase
MRAKMPRLPLEIGVHDFALRRQAPTIGEHTQEILAELGLKGDEIGSLVKSGIIVARER